MNCWFEFIIHIVYIYNSYMYIYSYTYYYTLLVISLIFKNKYFIIDAHVHV